MAIVRPRHPEGAGGALHRPTSNGLPPGEHTFYRQLALAEEQCNERGG